LARTNNSEKYVTQLFRKTSLTSYSFKKKLSSVQYLTTIYSRLDKNVKKIRSVPFHTYFQSSVTSAAFDRSDRTLISPIAMSIKKILIVKAHLPLCMKFEIIHSVFCKSFLRDIFILC